MFLLQLTTALLFIHTETQHIKTQELPWTLPVFHTLISASSADLVIFISPISHLHGYCLDLAILFIISNQICWRCLLNASPYLLSSCSIPFPTQLSDVSSEDVFISQWKCHPGLQDSACLVLTCSQASFVFLALCMLAMWPYFHAL